MDKNEMGRKANDDMLQFRTMVLEWIQFYFKLKIDLKYTQNILVLILLQM